MKRSAYVHLGYGFAADHYREKYRQGLVPDAVPYGIHHAETMGWRVAYSVDAPENQMEHFLRRGLNSLLGFDIIHAWRNRSAMMAADIIWTMEERQGLAVLLLKFFLPVPPVILQIIWLFDRWSSYGTVRKALLRRLLLKAARVTVHSSRYPEFVRNLNLGFIPIYLPFGISSDSFPERTSLRPRHDPIHVLAMGSDATRDWKTFLAAFSSDTNFRLVAISPNLSAEELASIDNLTIPVRPSMKEFVGFYEWADVVVIPMVPNLYSGITVALEATRCGVAVVSSRTGGVPTYLNEDEAIYVQPKDPDALRRAVLTCHDELRASVVERAQARFAKEDYTTRGLSGRYIRLSEEVLGTATTQLSN